MSEIGWKAVVDAIGAIRLTFWMKEQPLDSWPDHMRAVFAHIGQLMGGKRLTPELLAHLPDDSLDVVDGHRVRVSHRSAAELGDKRGRYTVAITGPRIDGQWHIWPGQMEKLSREAALTVSNVR